MILTSKNRGNYIVLDTMVNGQMSTLEGRIQYDGGNFWLCVNMPGIGGHGGRLLDSFGYDNAIVIHNDLRRISEYVPNVLSARLKPSITVYFKQGNTGILFKRVYKTDGDMIFMGTAQKDIEDCKRASALITVFDKVHIEQNGWKLYEKEPSAEELLKQAGSKKG